MDNELNLVKSNYETILHIMRVSKNLHLFAKELLDRADKHDKTKLEEPEASEFAKVCDKLSETTFGSKEYEENKQKIAKALNHHYANNRHHPQHFKNGMSDMNLIDIIEMFCDWEASSHRHRDGNIRKSIEKNGSIFNMSQMLINIFENTANLFDE